MEGEVNLVAKPQEAFWSIHNPISKWSSVVFMACDFTQKVVENGNPGTCFPKVPKTFRARKAINKTPTRVFCEAGLFML